MLMKNSVSGKISSMLVIIQKIQSFMMRVIRKLLSKWKMNLVEFYCKMYLIKKITGKEHNTAKGGSIATKFDKFKDVLFNKRNY